MAAQSADERIASPVSIYEKKWHALLTIGGVRTYVSADGKIEMTVRPDGRGREIREFAVFGKPRQRYASEGAARAKLGSSADDVRVRLGRRYLSPGVAET